jgi:hypothetical protein
MGTRGETMSNVTQLPGTKTQKSLTELVADVMKELPAQLELISIRSKLTRHAYNSLIAQGFSKSEALSLCTQIIM